MNDTTLYCTSRCNRHCADCIMREFMATRPDYEMSPDEICRFLSTSAQSGYHCDVVLSGGEPLLWQHLYDGLRLLTSSCVCRSVRIFSNGLATEAVNPEIITMVQEIRFSQYGENTEQLQRLRDQYGRKIRIVDRQQFWPNPSAPVPNSLPVECLNPEVMLADYRVYACPHSAAIAIRIGYTVPLSVPLEVGYRERLRRIRRSQAETICAACISNQKVRQQLIKQPNVKTSDRHHQ